MTVTVIKTRTKIALVFIVLIGLFSFVPPQGAFFFSLFIVFLTFRIDPRILGVVTIGLLVSIPILQHFDMNERGEQVAVYVYFLLVIIVVLQIVGLRSKGNTVEGQESIQSKVKGPSGLKGNTVESQKSESHQVDTNTSMQTLKASASTFDFRPDRPATKVKPVHEVKSAMRRDLEKEEHIPSHRLQEEEIITHDAHGIPLHLSLPERLKLLSEQKRSALKPTKPTIPKNIRDADDVEW